MKVVWHRDQNTPVQVHMASDGSANHFDHILLYTLVALQTSPFPLHEQVLVATPLARSGYRKYYL